MNIDKMSLKKVKGNLERLFDKNLADLIRGIRNNKDNEAKYINQCIDEMKEELKHDNLAVKSNAISKLTYLQMLGYDISWASFNIVEVMSSGKFTHKRIGYLAASQSFHEHTEVMMLTTNLIRKDLYSINMYDAGAAMSGLACFVTGDLAQDLGNDVITLLTSNKPYLRKKSVLLLYKIFLRHPEALRVAFPRLKEKLEDPDPGVQSAAVNVVCELARKNPKNYLGLAPIFFKLMQSSTNNWMLIKIIKLFGALTPLEPRLGKKLIEPLTELIHSTSAMSLLYECINTVIAVLISISSGLPNHNASIQLCVSKLRILIEDSDQNLKYLGLLALAKILKTHPKSVQAHKDLVLNCLEDRDESIRLRALDLLYGMVSKKNLKEIAKKLLVNINVTSLGGKFRDQVILKLIDICSQNDYQFVDNFEWYISVLIELSRLEGGTEHGDLIAAQLLDVSIRVESIRPFAVSQMIILLENHSLFASSSISEVLYASAWICGEFYEFLPDTKQKMGTLKNLVTCSAGSFPAHIRAVFLQNACKIYSNLVNELRGHKNHSNGDLTNGNLALDDLQMLETLNSDILSSSSLLSLLVSEDLEVQERATVLLEMVTLVADSLDADADNTKDVDTTLFSNLFYAHHLNPVAAKAQRKVPLPVGLILDEPLRGFLSESDSDSEDLIGRGGFGANGNEEVSDEARTHSPRERRRLRKAAREARKAAQQLDPNYLKASKSESSKKSGKKSKDKANRKSRRKQQDLPQADSDSLSMLTTNGVAEAIELPDGDVPNVTTIPSIPGLVSSDRFLIAERSDRKKKRKETKEKSRKREEYEDHDGRRDDETANLEDSLEDRVAPVVRQLEMPEGFDPNAVSDEDDDADNSALNQDPHKALANLTLEDLISEHKKPPIISPTPTVGDTKSKKKSSKKNSSDKTEKGSHKKKKKAKEGATSSAEPVDPNVDLTLKV